MAVVSVEQRLATLRSFFGESDIEAYIVRSEDAHNSEYPCDADLRVAFISGFTGSAGFVLVTKDSAFLWTDSRYYLQAAAQLDPKHYTLMKDGLEQTPSLSDQIKSLGLKRVGYDPYVESADRLETLKKALQSPSKLNKLGAISELAPASQPSSPVTPVTLVAIYRGMEKGKVEEEDNLVDRVWAASSEAPRPAYPSHEIVAMPEAEAGMSVQAKLEQLRKIMSERQCRVHVVSALADVAYLFNLRGLDCRTSRIFVAYALVTDAKAFLFLSMKDANGRLAICAQKQLESVEGLEIRAYNDLFPTLDNLMHQLFSTTTSASATSAASAIVPSPSDVTMAPSSDPSSSLSASASAGCDGILVGSGVSSAIEMFVAEHTTGKAKQCRLVKGVSPLLLMRGVKNPAELRGMIRAHIYDGVALALFFTWLASLSYTEIADHDEVSVADKLEWFRSQMKEYVTLSFPTISSVDSNAAVIHYKPEKESCKKLNPEGVLLLDSGAHYVGGTTDVTRTVHLGNPSAFEKDLYTRVLMGHVDLASVKFPAGLVASNLDVLARQHLWAAGQTYNHGTGHGVGHSLEVHEGSPSISVFTKTHAAMAERLAAQTALSPGMCVSNEPGIYLDGRFGVRIENVQYVKREPAAGPLPVCGFEQLTLAPYCLKLIDASLLSDKQVAWINAYHALCEARLVPELEALANDESGKSKIDPALAEAAIEYIQAQCAAI